MRAAFLVRKRKIVIEDLAKPRLEKPTDVLVRVKTVGICGSDVHYYLEGKIGDQVVENRIILGHEAAGTVAEVGPKVTSLKQGDRVAIEPGTSCGKCESCIQGKPNLCPNVQFFGTPPVDGALREFLVMPEENLFPIPENLSLQDGVLSEPLAIGLYGVRLSRIRVGDDVAVLGAGPIGLSVIFSARMSGAKRIFASDLLSPRLKMAGKLGADTVVQVSSQESLAEVIRQETKGRGVDIAYEAAGKAETFKEAAEVTRIGGKTVILGIPEDDRMEFDAHVVRKKELPIINVRRSAHCTGLALELLARKERPFSDLVTHTFPLEEIETALNLAAEYKDGVIKAVVTL